MAPNHYKGAKLSTNTASVSVSCLMWLFRCGSTRWIYQLIVVGCWLKMRFRLDWSAVCTTRWYAAAVDQCAARRSRPAASRASSVAGPPSCSGCRCDGAPTTVQSAAVPGSPYYARPAGCSSLPPYPCPTTSDCSSSMPSRRTRWKTGGRRLIGLD